MSMNRSIKHVISEHKTAFMIAFLIIMGGSAGTYFIMDYLNAQNPNQITLATTTSTYDSGLLDYLLPKFTQETGVKVRVLSVGTGQAIAYGQSGDTDVILVHSRPREDAFVNDSGEKIPYGIHRACIMYNDFIIIGDISNPADLQLSDNITTVMIKLKNAMDSGNVTFYSRGDGSGTHSKELSLWALIGINPENYWFTEPDKYAETGSGMATTLLLTYEDVNDANKGYTLIDRGTWLTFNNSYTTLKVLKESNGGEEILLNPYGFIPVNPERHPHVKYKAVLRLGGFLTSVYGQNLIDNFRKSNEILFHANFGFCNETLSCSTTNEEVTFWTANQIEFEDL